MFIVAVPVTTIVLVGCCLKKSLTKTRRVDPDTEMQRNHAYASAATSGKTTASGEYSGAGNSHAAVVAAEGASVAGDEVRPQSDGYVYIHEWDPLRTRQLNLSRSFHFIMLKTFLAVLTE